MGGPTYNSVGASQYLELGSQYLQQIFRNNDNNQYFAFPLQCHLRDWWALSPSVKGSEQYQTW